MISKFRQCLVFLVFAIMASLASANTESPILEEFRDTTMLKKSILSLEEDASTTTYTNKNTDLSLKYLGVIFGDYENIGTQSNTVIGEAFRMFNLGLLAVVSFIVGYTVITSVIGSAQDGAGAFSSRVSPWTLARTTAGVSLMVPMASGYSLVQKLVMQVALMGIAFANTAWVGVIKLNESEMTVTGIRALTVVDDSDDKRLYEITAMRNMMTHVPFNLFKARVRCKFDNSDSVQCDNINVVTVEDGSVTVNFPTNVIQEYKILSKDESIWTTEITPDGTYVSPAFKGSLDAILAKTIGHDPLKEVLTLASEDESGVSALNDASIEQRYDRIYKCVKITDLGCQNRIAIAQEIVMGSHTILAAGDSVSNDDSSSVGGKPHDLQNEVKTWEDEAIKTGWLSAGIYYNELSPDAEKVPDSKSLYNKPDARLALFRNPSTIGEDLIEEPGKSVSLVDLQKKVIEALNKMAKGSTTDESGNIEKWIKDLSEDNELFNRISTFLSEYRPNDENALSITDQLVKLDTFLDEANTTGGGILSAFPAQIKGHPGSGKTISDWYLGVRVDYPLRNLVEMSKRVVYNIIGMKYENSLGTLNIGCHKTFNQDLNLKDYDWKVGDPSVVGGVMTSDPDPSCYYQGSLLYSVLFPTHVLNPLKRIQQLGTALLDAAIRYYDDTQTQLYEQTKILADKYFNKTSAIMGGATAGVALTYGSPLAAAGSVAQTAAEIAVSDQKLKFNGTKVALDMFVSFGTAIAGIFVTLGVMLGIYLPILPFVLFLFGGVAWLMSIVEAMVAAPLVALGMTHPEGHDLLGKSEQAMILMLGVFVRPITMLFGLLMAIVASQILLTLFHIGFSGMVIGTFESVVYDNVADQAYAMGAIAAGIILVYVYVLMSIIEQTYSLIYVIPERILKWIGGPAEQSGVGQLAQQVKQETSQAAGQAGSGAGASTKAPSVAPSMANVEMPESNTNDEEDSDDKEGGASASGSDNNGGSAAGGKGGGKNR